MNISGNTTKIGLPEGSPKNFVAEKEAVEPNYFIMFQKVLFWFEIPCFKAFSKHL